MAERVVGDRYRLQELVGRGGTATVWRGVDLDTGDPVAVKVLDAAQAARPVAVERLRREAQAVARLAHPNIVASRGVGIDSDASFLAMELVDGPTVADLLTMDGPLPVDQAITIAEQVCAALAAAHAAGVVHRDIKPGNLIIDPAGVVKVCDFGIARLRGRDPYAALTGPSEAVGTCEYMAPEQANGDPVDARTDLYSLGCVLYAMLVGQPPFLGDHAMAVVHQHLHRPPVPVRALRGEVPAELDELVGRLLAKDPAHRPNTATEARARLATVRIARTTGAPGHDGAVTDLSRPTAVLARPGGRHRPPSARLAALRRWRTAAVGPGSAAGRWLRRWWVSAAAAASILTVTAGVAAVVIDRSPVAPPAAAPSATTAAPATNATPPLETTAAPTTAAPSSPPAVSGTAAVIDRLAAFAGTVQRQMDRGDLAADAGRDLLNQLGEVAAALRDGKTEKAVKRLREVDRRLAELRRDGKLTAAGFAALDVIGPLITAIR